MIENLYAPLEVTVQDGLLTITIGIDNLADDVDALTGFEVTDSVGFAKDVARALLEEDEIGSSRLTELFDDAVTTAIEDGSVNIYRAEDDLDDFDEDELDEEDIEILIEVD